MKITSFKNIPQFTRSGQWECNYHWNRLLSFIKELISDSSLNMNPDFQREHVWTEKQQIKFIEFFLQGGTTGRVLYFNNPSWRVKASTKYNDFVIVDGKQRIRAIERFMNNEIQVFGSYLSDFKDEPRFSNGSFLVNVNDLQTKKEVLQWYLEMNSGGTVHTDEEIEKVKLLLAKEK